MGENVGFVGAGDVYIRRRLTGETWTGWADSGGADRFMLQANAEQISQTLKGRLTYGQSADAVNKPTEPRINITFNRPNRKVIAALLLGDVSDKAVTGASVTGESHAVPEVGEGVFLAYRDVSAVTIGTLVEGTDYRLNAEAGFIENLADTPGGTWSVNYTYANFTGFKIAGMTQTKVELQIRMDGINKVDNTPAIVDVWSAEVSPSEGWDMLADQHSPVALEGVCNTPVDKDEPFTIDIGL